MRALGVQRLFGPCAAGSLTPDIRPGEFVVLDQLVDRTNGRSADTFFDGGVVGHVSFADPYCPELRALTAAAGRATGVTVHDEGTVVVVPGPRFSTRAESTWFRRQGWHTINMTQYPEAYLARELGLCYSGVALVTDFDAGVEDDPTVTAVTMDDVFAVLRANVAATRSLLFAALPQVPLERTACGCAAALDQGPLRS
jgi:5'-methylthioadenosine phosphorylase